LLLDTVTPSTESSIMNIPAQNHRKVAMGVVSVFQRFANPWRARPARQGPIPIPAALAGGINITVHLHEKAPYDVPLVLPRERAAWGHATHAEQSAYRPRGRFTVARFERVARWRSALAGYVRWPGRRSGDAAFHPDVESLKPLLNIVPAAMIVVDSAHRVVLANEPAAALFGYTAQELGDMSFMQLFSRIADNVKDRSGSPPPGAPDDELTDAAGLRTAIARCKDGGERAVSVKCAQYGVDGASPWIVMIADPCEPEQDFRGDDSQRAQLARASELGEMAAALSHEINQPLTAILSNAQAAQRFMALTPSDPADLREALADIVADSCRATEIVRKLRQFVRRAPPETLPLDMCKLVGEVMHFMRREAAARGIRMTLDSAGPVPMVCCDRIQLQQVMINLLLNAFDAVEGCCAEDRVVSMEVSTTPQAEAVRIAVRDRGLGLNADQIGDVFKPFATTKPHGLGLGLSISRSIVSMHGGHLWAESNGDRGATFHVMLPATRAAEGPDSRHSS
jgi:two-component system sensor kinase FixL